MSKKNLMLGGILVILIIAAYLYQGPLRQWRAGLGKPQNFLAGITADDINKIAIERNGQTSELVKQGDQWKVGGTKEFYLADDWQAAFINQFNQAQQSGLELVSANPDNKSEFQTDASGAAITLLTGDSQLEFTVGKLASDFSSTYVSPAGSDNTYTVAADLNSLFDREDWYDRTVFQADKDKIDKIRFQYPNREFTIAKQDDNWRGILPYSFSVSREKVELILQIMSDLTAAEIPEQSFAGTGLEKHLIIIQASGEAVDNTLMVGDDNGQGLYYAKRGDSDNIYLISQDERNELDKQIWQLR